MRQGLRPAIARRDPLGLGLPALCPHCASRLRPARLRHHQVLGKRLRLGDIFKEGLPLGQTLTRANPVTIAVLGKNRAAFTATFNELFAKPQGKDGVFVAGEALGTISFMAQGQ